MRVERLEPVRYRRSLIRSGGSQVVEKMNSDIDCGPHGTREEPKANGKPEEYTDTLELAFNLRHAGILLCCATDV